MSVAAYTDHLPGRTVLLDGKEFLYCSGTSYLGMACNPAFQELVQQGMRRYGTNYSSSRRSNLQLRVYDEAEEKLAAQTGAEAALTMSSGFLAGQTLVHALCKEGRFLYAPCAHPALWLTDEAAAQANAPISFETWVAQTLERVVTATAERFILVCNALDPLHAQAYSFDWVAHLPASKRVILILDDSHGFGVCGSGGAGIYKELSKYKNVELLVVSSFGKALGIPAGFILCSRQRAEQVKASSYFGGASPAIPAYLQAYLQADELVQAARQQLALTIDLFLDALGPAANMFRFIPGYPVFSTRYEQLADFLMQRGILISRFRYPTAASEPITRVILNSLHQPEDLKRVTAAINQFEPEIVVK